MQTTLATLPFIYPCMLFTLSISWPLPLLEMPLAERLKNLYRGQLFNFCLLFSPENSTLRDAHCFWQWASKKHPVSLIRQKMPAQDLRVPHMLQTQILVNGSKDFLPLIFHFIRAETWSCIQWYFCLQQSKFKSKTSLWMQLVKNWIWDHQTRKTVYWIVETGDSINTKSCILETCQRCSLCNFLVHSIHSHTREKDFVDVIISRHW